jgi:hypothetical protein
MLCPDVRSTPRWMAFLALGVTAASLAAPRPGPAQDTPPARMTLLGTLAAWKYPGSTLLGGATMSDGGNPSVLDVRCQAILTTPDPFENVTEFYAQRVGTRPVPGGPDARAKGKEADAQAVATQDDSGGRPVALRLIVVSTADTTTTLVISRAKSETETHIAWTHYRRFKAADR